MAAATVAVVVIIAKTAALLFLSPRLAGAQPWQYCGSSDARYSPNSTYAANLAAVSSALPRNASSSPALFATAAVGAAPADRVFALALCRGDGDGPACLGCVAGAFQVARDSCPYNKEVAVLYDACFVYFSGEDFLATTANVAQITLRNTVNDTGGATAAGSALFVRQVRALLDGAARWAAYRTPRRFATARMYNGSVASPWPTLYALTQCTPDLSPGDCWGCLQDLIVKSSLTGGTIGARTAGVRCSYRYENYAFYRGEPMLNMGTPPPRTIELTTGGGPNSGKRRNLYVISAVVVPLLAIFACVFCIRWVRRLRKVKETLQGEAMTNCTVNEGASTLLKVQDADLEFTQFDFLEIVEATGKFSEEHKLGQGGFGSVYKVVYYPEDFLICNQKLEPLHVPISFFQ